ncbi:MAG: hypothetical protein ACXADS_12575 [Candidatus Thorarchaeota archaeon]|jgi:hypothetical protein
MSDIPTFDYWMIGILKECTKTEIKRAGSGFPAKYIVAALEKRNKHNDLGQLQLILDRLDEIQQYYDNEIQEALGKR